jgi:hypothetical protein
MEIAEVVAKLDAIVDSDPEGMHSDADDVLLEFVPASVRAAYERVVKRADAWWYA